MLPVDRKKRHNFCYSQKLRLFLRQLKQALASKKQATNKVRNLETYRTYFDTAYPDYADMEYAEIRRFVLALPQTEVAEALLNSEEARLICELITPVIKIKNYKSQTPFPLAIYEAAMVIVNIKNTTPSANVSESHVTLINELLELQGFQLPTVSAVLHFCHPGTYPIVDRNIEAACGLLANEYPEELTEAPPALPASTTSSNNKLKKYRSFISFLNLIATLHNQQHQTNYGLRELDKALMVYGVESLRARAENANE